VVFKKTKSMFFAIRQQRYRSSSAAVGADLSCPHIWMYPRNGGR